MSFPLWAVHIDDGILTPAWIAGGFAVTAVMVFAGAWRIKDEEVPRVALLAAAFFVASLIHVPVPGGPRTHLLLNGLLGVILGPRALLAIPLGLFLQAALFGHGGFTALGVNSCVMGLPALASWLLFAALRRVPWTQHAWFRAGLVILSAAIFFVSLAYSIALLLSNPLRSGHPLDLSTANAFTFHPLTLAVIGSLSLLAAWAERWLENAPEFPLGLLIGELSVLLTIVLNAMALLWGGTEDWHTLALLTLVIHLPLAVLEGTVLGFVVGFLVKVKPEMLSWSARKETPCVVDSPG